jgi:hypothetical protein
MIHTQQSVTVLRLRALPFAASILAVFSLIATSAHAREVTTADGQKSICLPAQNVENTEALNDHQILFHMRDHKVFVNNLSSPCRSLKDINDDGFIWVADTPIPEYCDNIEHIRVRRTGETCMLGAFSPYETSGK